MILLDYGREFRGFSKKIGENRGRRRGNRTEVGRELRLNAVAYFTAR
ncbi:MAG: hypothetical protein FWH20_11475 [Oscillospiraceae bacterium]|nr:hypothetical protein [Oscillospiraceae bacterium]